MAMNNTNTTDNASNAPQYTLDIDDVVVEKITSYSAQKIDGIVEMKGNLISTIQEGLGNEDQTKGVKADVQTDDQRVSVDLSIILEYGKSASDVFDRVKRSVTKDIKQMTDLDIEDMTVHVVDVMTRDEYRQQQNSKRNQQQQQNANTNSNAYAGAPA